MERDELIHILLDLYEDHYKELALCLIKLLSTEDIKDFMRKDLDIEL